MPQHLRTSPSSNRNYRAGASSRLILKQLSDYKI